MAATAQLPTRQKQSGKVAGNNGAGVSNEIFGNDCKVCNVTKRVKQRGQDNGKGSGNRHSPLRVTDLAHDKVGIFPAPVRVKHAQ